MTLQSILVFQHINVEHPGIFRNFFNDDGIQLYIVELDKGESIPNLKDFDALWVMGGPMDVWEKNKYPWLVEEISAIRRAIDELKMPFMGVCLGHQLLAYAYGAKVGLGDKSEVGVMPVRKTIDGKRSAFFCGLPDTMGALQWHSAEVKTVPEGFQVLAESDRCAIQSLSYGNKVFSVQYHQEITETTVSDWSKISEYKISLEKSLGKNAVEKLEKDVLANIDKFNYAAKLLYRNWKSTTFEN
jgi:GMP synthase-like glutamine amidotransferase